MRSLNGICMVLRWEIAEELSPIQIRGLRKTWAKKLSPDSLRRLSTFVPSSAFIGQFPLCPTFVTSR
jgi:hypothetical protein